LSNASQINGLVRWRDLCLASQSQDAKRQPANCAFEEMGGFTGAPLPGKPVVMSGTTCHLLLI